ncbi:lipoprotein [Acinetobacter sp. ANC 4636]
MKNIINFILVLLLGTSLTGCGVLFATGNWWNNDYATDEELWVHPNLSKVDADKIALKCSDMAINSVIGVKKFSEITSDKQKNIIKILTSENSQNISKLQEQCYLDHGFKFYPRGIKRNHPTVCFGESKKMPGCQSVFDIPIL